ncbi:TetR/AcrR family transcriptional regulator [Nocardioides daejeonensis]|uniref:TetR/AcrR family transcriptional regulator n=1 Tax=Nocardioides daejeonensis TaxID=1046556 RepID=UPI000D740E41|nr:TetR/AcrR family transcriptional regulator [Nocardioides daejeonensis]
MTSRPRPNAGSKGVPRAVREAEILESACRAFGEHGYAAVSMTDVAHDAGISKPLVYSYFGSKEGLFEACLRHAGDLIADDIDRTAASGHVGLERALVTLEGIFKTLEERRWIWRLFFDATRPATPALDAIVERYTARLTERGAEGTAEMLARGGNRDPLDADALAAVWASVFDALVVWWLNHPEVTAEEMTARSVRLLSAVTADPSPAPSAG